MQVVYKLHIEKLMWVNSKGLGFSSPELKFNHGHQFTKSPWQSLFFTILSICFYICKKE